MGLQCSITATVPWSGSTRHICVFHIWTSNFKFGNLIQWMPFHTMWWKNCTLSLKTSFPSVSKVYIYAVISVGTLLVTFSEKWLRNALSYISPFLLYFSLITLLSHCVNVYFLILVITEWVSIDKKAIFSKQTSLKTNNYVLPEWNGYCTRRDWLLQYYFQVSEFSLKALFCL
jgi:hypothetical protein